MVARFGKNDVRTGRKMQALGEQVELRFDIEDRSDRQGVHRYLSAQELLVVFSTILFTVHDYKIRLEFRDRLYLRILRASDDRYVVALAESSATDQVHSPCGERLRCRGYELDDAWHRLQRTLIDEKGYRRFRVALCAREPLGCSLA